MIPGSIRKQRRYGTYRNGFGWDSSERSLRWTQEGKQYFLEKVVKTPNAKYTEDIHVPHQHDVQRMHCIAQVEQSKGQLEKISLLFNNFSQELLVQWRACNLQVLSPRGSRCNMQRATRKDEYVIRRLTHSRVAHPIHSTWFWRIGTGYSTLTLSCITIDFSHNRKILSKTTKNDLLHSEFRVPR